MSQCPNHCGKGCAFFLVLASWQVCLIDLWIMCSPRQKIRLPCTGVSWLFSVPLDKVPPFILNSYVAIGRKANLTYCQENHWVSIWLSISVYEGRFRCFEPRGTISEVKFLFSPPWLGGKCFTISHISSNFIKPTRKYFFSFPYCP